MIFQDENGYPTQSTGDHGDSLVRIGIGTLTEVNFPIKVDIRKYELRWGWLSRSPVQPPWQNVLNCTPDQIKPALAGLNAVGAYNVIRRVFCMQCLRVIFGQDFQRDYPGTWKLPWKQSYIALNGQPKTTYFNFATPLLPNDIWCMIKGGHIYPLYIFYPICLLFTLIAIVSSAYGEDTEQNQIISELSFHPRWVMRLYTKINKNWATCNQLYWSIRGESEYASAIYAYVYARTKRNQE